MNDNGKSHRGFKIKLLGLSLAVSVLCGTTAVRAQTDADLLKPDPKNWVTWAGSYNEWAHSALKQVTPANAKNLVPKWTYHVEGNANIEATPIVYNGVMYISGMNRMDAIDARTGNPIWKYQRTPMMGTPQRGTAIYDNKLYIPTADRHIVALNALTGAVMWDVPIALGTSLNGAAPLVAKGHLIVGGSSSISSYDAKTGKYEWTFHTAPLKGEPGYDSWGGGTPGAANVWRSHSYDPEQNLLIYGTGSPPDSYAGENRPGDDQYVDSIVALDVDTGKLKWFFQNYPHDIHDWDSHESIMLVDMPYQGQMRKLAIQAHRGGFMYVLDRTNGKFLYGAPFIHLDWASGLTPEGRPIIVPGHESTLGGNLACPPSAGATNWPQQSYDPKLHYLILQSMEGCGIYVRSNSTPTSGGAYIEADTSPWQSYVRAIDVRTLKKVWEYKELRSKRYGPGLLSTDGGVVFAPQHYGQATVLDTRTGKVLWHYNVGNLITAGSVTYAIGSNQYFATVADGQVFAFGLANGGEKK